MENIYFELTDYYKMSTLQVESLHNSIPTAKGFIGSIICLGSIVGFFLSPLLLQVFPISLPYLRQHYLSLFYLFFLFGIGVGLTVSMPLGLSWKDLKLKFPTQDKRITIGLIFTVVFSYYFLFWVVRALVDAKKHMLSLPSSFSFSIMSLIVFKIIIVPIVEELLFREVFITFLSRCVEASQAHFISALIFATAHLANGMFLVFLTFFLALMLSSIRSLSQSITPCIIAHMLINFIAVFFPPHFT